MRNYLALNFCRINYNNTGPSDPATASVWITGTSIEDLGAQIEATRVQMGFITIVDVEDLGIWYFALDKTSVSRIWNKAVAGFPLNGPIFPADPPKENAQSFQPVDNTPRKGWTDPSGVKREPAPSDGGKGKPTSGGTDPFQQVIIVIGRIFDASAGKPKLRQQLSLLLNDIGAGLVTPAEALARLGNLIRLYG
jgi:hypothetical protein